MKQAIRKVIKWLNQPRYIEISFGTLETEDECIAKEFSKTKLSIMTKNYIQIMQERLIPFVRDNELHQSGLLLTDEQCFCMAQQLFCNAKKDGRIDELNNIVTDNSEVI